MAQVRRNGSARSGSVSGGGSFRMGGGGGGGSYRGGSRYGEEEEEGYGSGEDDFVFEMTKIRLKVRLPSWFAVATS